MKSILYAGGALMIGAAIYGFADYNKTKSSQEFNDLYREKTFLQPALITDKTISSPLIEPAIVAKQAKHVAKGGEEKDVLKKSAAKKGSANVTSNKKINKAKKVDSRFFSRAALKELPEIKKEPKKVSLPEEKSGQ